MPDAARILLVSPDLMVASRIAGLAGQCGATVTALHGGSAPATGSAYDLVIVDLQAGPDAGELVTRTRDRLAAHGPSPGRGPALVAFGPHVAVDRLAAARAAGADDVVSRGELLGGFATIVARHAR